MRYPVMIEAGDENTAWSVVVPDLAGCFSAGDTLDEAMSAVEEAAAAWIDAALDRGREIPRPSSAQSAMEKGDFSGWIVSYVNVDPALLDDTIERVNITLPKRVLMRLDAKARESGQSRSGYIAHMAIG
ncbi:type II toxin-antitoxin system HicB family antitoxin [Novilysobacter spongiicola]|uniref:Predicted nuclease of the RNAse H fold, HicB family n=1 Tax=Lysobacter spongiicola DSM 21749 TaxID=1122188 RepID=A0A1T4LS88_9GAMM|nr:type II toxin-antitoxin system HicB family antitoxin [Lysobacter spongiicola]SJZ57609.1 Predicted nuclease of the RNAse H fold, HicB family [Lysobacter spongiicola DSM 21749]